jgi:glycosyltransferase involved in cell wall biosynthesis
VAFDATSLYDVRTGVGRFVHRVLPRLGGRDDLDVRAYAVTFRGAGDLASLLPPGVAAANRRPMAARPLRELWKRADHGRIEHWVGAVDVVHGPNYVVPPARAARVVSVHDLTFVHHPEMCTADVLDYRTLVPRAIRGGAWVHTISDFVRHEVIDLLGADPDRVVTVPLAVEPAPSSDAGHGRALAGADRYVLALGTIEPRKDLPTLVAAFDGLAAVDAELRLVLAGPDGWGAEALAAAMAAARHADRIVRLGFVSDADRGDLLAGAAVVAVPSIYEGFGLVAAEALLAGRPVVATVAGAHPEVIGDAGLLVPVGDTDALAGALAQVLGDEELAAELGRRGPVRVADLTWERTADGLAALWRAAHSATRR